MSKAIIIGAIAAAIAFGLGIVTGVFGIDNGGDELVVDGPRENVDAKLMDNIDNERIREWLRRLTVDPHVGGTEEEEGQAGVAGMIEKHMRESGMTVKVSSYDVLLSYPQRETGQRNYVAIHKDKQLVVDETDGELKSAEVEQILDASQNNTKVFNPFIAYSTAGELYGEPVYVNYGRQADFEQITTLGIDLTDKICFVRYGKIFRGNKARFAEEAGCKGMVLFSDKADYAPDWSKPYPDDWFLPGTGAQRGTTYLDEGDPETPFYPSIEGAYRWTREKTRNYGAKHDLPGLPNIPVQPIGYDDAYKFLSRMKGDKAPADWQGGITDKDGGVISYNLGPGFADANEEMFMYIKNVEEIKQTKDVVGYIEGSEEPDKYIILGNHRDAWVFGAIDPTSGTCVLMEVITAFGKLLEQGWRPKRSILFASWGSEEYGLIGSQEWVEEHFTKLTANAVVYINTDIAVTGNHTFAPGGTPNARDIVMDVTKLIDNPRREIDSEEKGTPVETLYDNMLMRNANNGRVNFPPVGSGSDYAPFLQSVGVSVVDVNFASDGYYPVYHSVYETFELVDKFVDPGFLLHQSVARFLALMAERFSSEMIIPLSVNEYAIEIERQVKLLKADERIKAGGVSFATMDKYVAKLVSNAKTFTDQINAETDQAKRRILNEKLFRFERAFIDGNKLPNQLQFKHVVFAPSSINSYASAAFPAVYDSLYQIDWDNDMQAENVNEQFATLTFFIYNAAQALSLEFIL